MNFLPRLRRGRIAKRSRHAPRFSPHRLSFDWLENRCLLSSGFDPAGVVRADSLRSPLLDQDAKRQIAIRRFSADFAVVQHSSDPAHDDRLRIVYPDRALQRPLENEHERPNSDRILGRSAIRPGDENPARRPGDENSEFFADTKRRVDGLDGDGADGDEPANERTVSESARENIRPTDEETLARPPKPPSWRPDLPEAGAPSWNRVRFDEPQRLESSHRVRNQEGDAAADDDSDSALSMADVTAFHIAETASFDTGLASIDSDLLASVMEAAAGDADQSPSPHMVYALAGSHSQAPMDFVAIDRLFAANSAELGEIVNGKEYSDALTLTELAETAPDRDCRVSMGAAAAAVLVATRVESRSNRSQEKKKSRGFGWVGALAQLIVTRRFITPRRPTIMLAMREDAVRERFAGILRDDGYDVIDFGTLGEAVKHVIADWITLDGAVMDAELDFSGIHLFTRIRQKYPKLPVVVCGEPADQADMTQYRRMGARRCLLKPVEPSELLATVNALVW